MLASMGTPGKAPSGMLGSNPPSGRAERGARAFFAPLLVEAGSSMVAGTVGGLVFGFFGAGSASDWHAAGRLIIVPGPALSFSIGPAAKAAGEVAAGGTEAAEVGADCTATVMDCLGEGSSSGSVGAALSVPSLMAGRLVTWTDLWRRARASAPGLDHLENLSAGNIILNFFLRFQFLGASACLFLFLLIELLPHTFAGCPGFLELLHVCFVLAFGCGTKDRR